MHLGNIWVSDHFRQFWMRIGFFFWNVFRSKNLKSRKKDFERFFCLGGHFDQPQKFRVALARKIDVRRE